MASEDEGARTVMLSNQRELFVGILDSLQCLAEAADLVHPQLAAHHNLTGFIAASLAAEMQRPRKEQVTLLCAGLVHDIGAFSVRERLDVARFDAEDVFSHCLSAYALLSDFPSLFPIADRVRHHHIRWDHDYSSELRKEGILRDGHILHLADRVAVGLIGRKGNPMETKRRIIAQISNLSGTMFDPELVQVFRCLGEREGFWFDVTSLSDEVINRYWHTDTECPDIMPMSEMIAFFSRIIDFRSTFTASHSKAVAVVAEKLTHLTGLSEEDGFRLNVAGHLHDLGKLGVSLEILEKPGRLTEEELNVLKIHPYHTFHVLRNMKEFEDIRRWCRSHHEYLDGSGYPFHLVGSEICIFSRILTVADVFVALTEDRPYRAAISVSEAMRIIEDLARQAKIDARVVALTKKYSEEIYACMLEVRGPVRQAYEAFLDSSFFPAFA